MHKSLLLPKLFLLFVLNLADVCCTCHRSENALLDLLLCTVFFTPVPHFAISLNIISEPQLEKT